MTSTNQVRYAKLLAILNKPIYGAQVKYHDDNHTLDTLAELTIKWTTVPMFNLIKFCTNLTTLVITTMDLLDNQYAHFARLPNLINLSLCNVSHLDMLPAKLQSLSCRTSYESIPQLNRFTLLVSLKISITGSRYQLSSFNPVLPQLRHLELQGYVTAIDAVLMRQLETLTFFSHDRSNYSNEPWVPVDLSIFESAINMTRLNLKLHDSTFALDHFRHMISLTSLQVHVWGKTYALDLAPLHHLTNLKSLQLSNVWVISLEPLHHLQLESLGITDLETSPSSLFQNYNWDMLDPSHLMHLKLHARYDFETIQEEHDVLSKFTNLTSLDFNNLKAISSVASLTNLTSLSITGKTSNISTLEGIQHLQQLVTLVISNQPITNSELLYLKDMSLQHLAISNSRLSSLTNIAHFTSLQVLSLDVDVGDGLIELEPLIHLHDLTLYKSDSYRYPHYTNLDNIKATQIPCAIMATLRKLTNLDQFQINRKVRGKYMRLLYKKAKAQLDH
ncbi:Hypothetical protein MVR_LOCUS82 [uncultured virus]|nr:Hypothetical protein MVR_LOCUS82 [uncultured virus]